MITVGWKQLWISLALSFRHLPGDTRQTHRKHQIKQAVSREVFELGIFQIGHNEP
jgi:hypothetical protein